MCFSVWRTCETVAMFDFMMRRLYPQLTDEQRKMVVRKLQNGHGLYQRRNQ